LVPQRFHKWIYIFGQKISERILVKKMWYHVIELKEVFVLRKRKIYLLLRKKRGDVLLYAWTLIFYFDFIFFHVLYNCIKYNEELLVTYWLTLLVFCKVTQTLGFQNNIITFVFFSFLSLFFLLFFKSTIYYTEYVDKLW